MFRTVAIALLLALDGGLSVSAQESCTRRTIAVSVTDKDGLEVRNLTAGDFRGKFRGKPISIVSVAPSLDTGRLLVVLDASRSMYWRGSGKRPVPVELAVRALGLPVKDGDVGVLVFGSQILLKVGFGKGRNAALGELRTLLNGPPPAQGQLNRTALWDSLDEGLSLFSKPRIGDTVFVITDGGDNSSRARMDEIKQEFLSRGVRVFVFLLLGSPLEGAGASLGVGQIKALARDSGGIASQLEARPYPFDRDPYYMDDARLDLLDDVLRRLGSALIGSYEFGLELPFPVDKDRDWMLELVRRDKHTLLVYPRQLAPCSTQGTQ